MSANHPSEPLGETGGNDGLGAKNEPAFAGEVRVAVGAFSAAAVNG
jgi:hypothetical protein